MKPPPFQYLVPESGQEALEILSRFGDEASVLAGGQSLVPAMNFRLARPRYLIDINRLSHLSYLNERNGQLRIGALIRHVGLETLMADNPVSTLLHEAGKYVGHLPIRIRGTIGGSLAHNDPAAEWCVVACALGAEVVAAKRDGKRVIPIHQFLQGVLTTDLAPDELLTEVRLPLLPERATTAFAEKSRRAGDFALVAVAAVLELADDRIANVGLGLGGVDATARRAVEAEQVLVGEMPTALLFQEAARIAAREIDPPNDVHASIGLRRQLVAALVNQALEQAWSRGTA